MTAPGQVVTAADATEAADEAAKRIASALRSALTLRGRASIALSGGDTPRGAYARLARDRELSWSSVVVFWVDERAVPPTDDRSNYAWAKTTLLDPGVIPTSRVFRMAAERPDLEDAVRDYERLVRKHVHADEAGVPSFDVMVLGVGDDGHTASLFPGESTVDIDGRLVATVTPHRGLEARITLTAPVIEHARQVLVLVVGDEKRDALRRVWDEQGDLHTTPARVIRRCRGSVVWIVDRAAVPP